MTTQPRFAAASRLLHWLMAPMIITMLFIGVGMAASVSRRYDLLISIHRPLGIAILVLCVARIVNRFINPPPDLPGTVLPAAPRRQGIAYRAIYAHAPDADGRLGYAVGSPLSDRALRAAAAAADLAA
jgi:cytochrome b561